MEREIFSVHKIVFERFEQILRSMVENFIQIQCNKFRNAIENVISNSQEIFTIQEAIKKAYNAINESQVRIGNEILNI